MTDKEIMDLLARNIGGDRDSDYPIYRAGLLESLGKAFGDEVDHKAIVHSLILISQSQSLLGESRRRLEANLEKACRGAGIESLKFNTKLLEDKWE